MDLFRYTASGVPDYTDGRDGETTYFSSNGGATSVRGRQRRPGLSFNNEINPASRRTNSGDPADWTQQAVFGRPEAAKPSP